MDNDEATIPQEQPIAGGGPDAPPPLVIKFEATVRVADRRVHQIGHTRYAPHDLHPETLEPRIEAGLGVPDPALHGEHVVEVLDIPTWAAIQGLTAQIVGDGGVALSEDHQTVALVPPSQAWLDAEAARLADLEQHRADLDLLAEHGATHKDPVVQAAARLLQRHRPPME